MGQKKEANTSLSVTHKMNGTEMTLKPTEWTSNGSVIFYHFRNSKEKKREKGGGGRHTAQLSSLREYFQRIPHMVRILM